MRKITFNKRKIIVRALLPILAVWAYLWYFGPPPHLNESRWYPGQPNPKLEATISDLMADLRTKYDDPSLRNKMDSINEVWRRSPETAWKFDLRLRDLEMAATPYVEELTRSKDVKQREIAYDMLYTIDKGKFIRLSPDEMRDYMRERKKYLQPIWERGLYDSSPNVRYMSTRHISNEYLGTRGVSVFRRMLRDPDEKVRVCAAMQLMHYDEKNKWDLIRLDRIPMQMRLKIAHGDY